MIVFGGTDTNYSSHPPPFGRTEDGGRAIRPGEECNKFLEAVKFETATKEIAAREHYDAVLVKSTRENLPTNRHLPVKGSALLRG